MSFLSDIAGRVRGWRGQPRPEVANLTYSDAVMDAFGITPGAAGIAVTPVSAMRVSAATACVRKIAGTISTLRLDVLSIDGESEVKMPRDDLWYKLNEQPSPQFTATSHWEMAVTSQLLRGDGFTWIRRAMNGSIRELLPLKWSECQPQLQTDGTVRYFVNIPARGIRTWVYPFDMLHFPGDGFDGVRSMSVISYGARAAVGNALAMDEYSGKFFANGAHPSMILKSAGRMSEQQKLDLQSAFVTKYGGLDNAHRVPLVLTEGLDAKEISLSAQDAQLLEARKFQVVDIARAFGVPPHMIGETSGSSAVGAGYEQQARDFVMHTLRLHIKRLEQELNRKLFPRDTGKFVRFDLEDLIEGDSKAQAEYNRAALGGPGTGMGWMTVDEIRKCKGLAPMGGSAAELFDPNAAAEAAQAAAEAAQPAQADAAAKNLDTMRQIANDAQRPTVVNVAAPIVNVTVPEQAAPVVQNTVNVPEQAAPVVNNTVNVPETTVNVEAVMPSQETVVNVAAPVVNVESPTVQNYNNNIVNGPAVTEMKIVSMPDRVTTSTVQRDGNGNITKATNTEKDA